MSQKYLEIQIPKNIISILSQCITSSKSFNFQRFNKIKTQETDKFLEDNKITSTQLFKIWQLNLPGIPLCLNCGKRLEGLIDYHTFKPLKYCCHKCQVTDSNNIEKQKQTWKNKSKKDISNMMDKRKKTCIEKYGTEAYCQTDEWKEKYRNACIEKYGVEGYSQTDEWKNNVAENWNNKTQEELNNIKEKWRKTNLEKYGVDCYTKTNEYKEKYKFTMNKRYGVDNPLQSVEIMNKKKETCKERYGIENTSQLESVKEKMKNTNLERYGTICSLHSVEIQEKVKKTNLERYGYEYSSSSPEIREKVYQTNIEKYGYKSYSQTNEWWEKYKKTSLKKYGVEYPFRLQELQEKYRQTCLKKYGCEWVTQSTEYKEKHLKTIRNKNYERNKEKLKIKGIDIISNLNEYINIKNVKYKCNVCETYFESEYTDFQKVKCPKCTKPNMTSEEENILCTYISNIYDGLIIKNDREILNGKELDIYIPDKQLAIEYNGTYWHNLDKVGKYYHQEKSLRCKGQGIRLIHIFEYEWNNKQEICKSIIKSAIGLYDKKIYARKCIVKDISVNDYKDFLEENHLQGSINSSIRYGLFYNDELVSVIGFGKSRFKKNEMELHRFCSKLNYQVIGAFSKLIKHNNVTNFITYVDLAHFNGYGYKQLGFKEISITEPNYKWVKENIILNRFQTQKHKLVKLLKENYNNKLTEAENMILNKYIQIYDSGNIKFYHS